MSTYLMFNQLRIIHPQFRPKSRTSVLEPSQNFLSIVRARSKEEAICRRGPHISWLKRATIRLLSLAKPSRTALSRILILPCCHSKCCYKLAVHFPSHIVTGFYIKVITTKDANFALADFGCVDL
ncbi:neurotrimin-like isoform X2 [Vespula squamosa]|uniref:Neurotrimin-like isoform X2 n=1 Tax=Vespula squamosa TaxID=30214 RepID=A0ABD2B7E9_VESSQ